MSWTLLETTALTKQADSCKVKTENRRLQGTEGSVVRASPCIRGIGFHLDIVRLSGGGACSSRYTWHVRRGEPSGGLRNEGTPAVAARGRRGEGGGNWVVDRVNLGGCECCDSG